MTQNVQNIIAGTLAFIIYGSWAAWVNSEYGIQVSLRAGLGQGIYAFFSTWFVTSTARKMLVRYGNGWLGKAVSFTTAFLVMLAFPAVIHNVLRTPDIIEAILPGLIWGSGYIGFVIWVSAKTTASKESDPSADQLS